MTKTAYCIYRESIRTSSVSYRIAMGPQQAQKVFTLQTLPASTKGEYGQLANTPDFSLYAGVFTNADEPDKLERLCRYISRPAISEQRLNITKQGQVRYELKTPYRDGTDYRLVCMYSSHPSISAFNATAISVYRLPTRHNTKN